MLQSCLALPLIRMLSLVGGMTERSVPTASATIEKYGTWNQSESMTGPISMSYSICVGP